jgi:hypothetical protein
MLLSLRRHQMIPPAMKKKSVVPITIPAIWPVVRVPIMYRPSSPTSLSELDGGLAIELAMVVSWIANRMTGAGAITFVMADDEERVVLRSAEDVKITPGSAGRTVVE